MTCTKYFNTYIECEKSKKKTKKTRTQCFSCNDITRLFSKNGDLSAAIAPPPPPNCINCE